jgi:hypothetical protein
MNIFAIEKPGKGAYFEDKNAEGWVGLQLSEDGTSFLDSLKKNGYITNKIFSIFIEMQQIRLNAVNSVIKFGGYDVSGIAAGETLT